MEVKLYSKKSSILKSLKIAPRIQQLLHQVMHLNFLNLRQHYNSFIIS